MNAPGSWGTPMTVAQPPKRFAVRYHLAHVGDGPTERVRIQVWLDDGQEVPSVVARLAHRRLARARAVRPDGHPLRGPSQPAPPDHADRLGRAIRSGRTTRSAASRCSSRTRYEHDRERPPAPVLPLYEPAKIPPGAPSKVDPPPGADLITVNFGPNHPSTHGVLRLIVTLDGEVVVGLDADIGYVHTGFEKNFEQKTYWKGIPYAPADGLRRVLRQRAGVRGRGRAADRHRGAAAGPVDPDALRRAEPHPQPPDLPGHVRRRDGRALGLLLLPARARQRARPLRDGDGRSHARPLPAVRGRRRGPAKGLLRRVPAVPAPTMPKRIDEYLDLLAGNPVWKSRYQGIGTITGETAIAMGLSGPNLRASGVPYDIRRTRALPGLRPGRVRRHHRASGGDAYDRFMCRTLEMYESVQDRRAVPRLDAVGPGHGARPQVRAAAARTSCTRRWSRSSTTSSS